MRRTYKSKKDTGGTLDARDVLQNMSEKSSVFEAFYIQNIKQTKRELSCVIMPVHNGVTSNKVRKRKYVKRILKEVEPVRQRDTMSSSAYLTPDRSIRVNKFLDPFDMLLNSTPTFQDAPKPKREHVFEEHKPKKECKTYIRKKQPRLKKINYSSSDSNYIESDKENRSEQSQSNVTDIRTHELLVETEPTKSPHNYDESITKIVNNLSLINNFKCRVSNSSFNSSYKCDRNKVTKNFLLPTQPTSPLCSTPFKEKYRGASIYKFSPITQRETSPGYGTIPEEKDDINISIIFNCNKDNSKVFTEYQVSPLTHLPNMSIKSKSYVLDNEIEHNCSNIHEYAVQNEVKDIDGEIQPTDNSVSTIEDNSFSTEPFLGFSNNTPQDILKDCLQLKHLQIYDSIERECVINDNDLETNECNIGNLNSISESVASDQCNTSQSSVTSNNLDKESMYDTCNSEQSSVVDDCAGIREPIVAIERMNDSVFLRYYEMLQTKTQSEETDNDEFESLANDTNDEMLNISLSTESDCIETKPNAIVITDSSTTEDVISSNDEEEVCNNEDEICVSFVTTRRKHEITNDSMFIFDNSYSSTSTNCDKTILSNIKVNLEKPDVNISLDSTVDVENDAKDNFNLTGSPVDRISSINRSSKLPRESSSKTSGDAKSYSILNDSIHSNISSKNNRKTLKSPRQSKFISTADNIKLDLNLSESVSNDKLLETTRKSSRLTVQYNPVSSTKDNLKLTENSRDKRISRIRRKSNVPLKSNSTSSESDTSNNEITLIDTNETNNDNVDERNDVEIDLNDLGNRDTISRLISRDISSMFIESNVKNYLERSSYAGAELKPNIVLQPGKKWERSLSIYRRMTMTDNLDQSILEDECLQKKGRKYRQSVISTMEMQECRDSLYNDSINSRRSSCISKPSRPTIRFVKDPNIPSSRVSINTSSVFDDLKGFLNEECDDTVIELSKLSIADSEHEVTILDNFHETERVATARDYVLRRCNQTEPILFDECYPETVLKNCHKIGEGVYGEVFLWRGRDGRARVMKIVPIAGNIKVNGEDQKDFHEIISEIVIAMELSALRAPIAEIERQLDEGNDIRALDLHTIANATDIFNEVLAVRCLYGAYPSRLLDLWELYDECKGSENDNPASLPHDQRYIVLELANAGQDLESYQFASAQQAHALFQQIAFGLAVAEEAFQFEHRDLHWGNVLIAPTEQKFATFVLRGRAYRVARCGVAATVIDYSLSRLSLPLAADSAALYNDLATDEQLFDAVGDYQFEVYRLMRDKLGNDWKNFDPYTNILWLHYTVDKMITALRYKRTNTKIHKHYIEKLKEIKDRILEYGSAVQYVLTDI